MNLPDDMQARPNRLNVLHVMRSINANSTPWNDLYRYSRRMHPGACFPPIRPVLSLRTIRIRKAPCGPRERVFLEANPLGMVLLLRRFRRHSQSRGRQLLLHSHAPTLFWVTLVVQLLFRDVVLVTNLHNEWPEMRRYQRFGLSVMAHLSRKLICVSKAIQKNISPRIRERLAVRGALEAIQNGIPSDEMDQGYPVAAFPSPRVPDVVVVARMVPQKNYEQILSVFAGLRHARHLVWYGDGALRPQIEDRARALGLGDRLVLKGLRPRSEVMDSLSTSAVYLSCSLFEGIGVANIEAAAMGARIFLSDIPPHREIVEELGLTTYPLNDAKSWTADIDAALCDVAAATAASEAAQRARTVRRAFDLATKTDEYFRVYAEAARR